MNICKAVGLRISKLLSEKDMTLYRLEQKSGILHGTMMCIMNERNKNITLKTVMQLARGFEMTLLEFLDDKIFTDEKLEID
ncbi:MAG: helix-turn-helix domain-containing protein [Clostridia bacterium]|nr:helix-turn-helix domain-containing protein [Clostridia bacterium]